MVCYEDYGREFQQLQPDFSFSLECDVLIKYKLELLLLR